MTGIMMLVNEFPPLPTGGAEKQAERLALYLASRGWKVGVLTRRLGNLSASEWYQGVEIIRPRAAGPGKLKTLTFLAGCLAYLSKMRGKYSILHAHLAFGPALVAVLAARWFGKRVIVKFGNSGDFGDIQTSQRTLRGRLRLALLRRWADVIVTLDEQMKREVLAARFPAARIRKMANGIDAGMFAPDDRKSKTRELLSLPRGVIFLYVGRLAPQKSLPTLLHALAGALPFVPDIHLLFVGDGDQRFELEQQATNLGVSDHVGFAGSQTDVLAYLHASDVFVLPSLGEGISNALLEAMSAQLACAASDVGGNGEILDHGRSGIVLPTGDIPAWTNAFIELGRDGERRKRLGEEARKRVLECYDFQVVGRQYEELYAELSGSPARSDRS